MSENNKFSPEARERAVPLMQEHRGEYPSLWAAVASIVPKIGCAAYTLLKWVQFQEVGAGTRSGVPQVEQERIKALEREIMNAELSRVGRSRVIIPTLLHPQFVDCLPALTRGKETEPLIRTISKMATWCVQFDYVHLDKLLAQLRKTNAFEESPAQFRLLNLD